MIFVNIAALKVLLYIFKSYAFIDIRQNSKQNTNSNSANDYNVKSKSKIGLKIYKSPAK